MIKKIARYGWVPDIPDHDDFKLTAVRGRRAITPPIVDQRPHSGPIYDQGQVGSCTGNGWSFMHKYTMVKEKQLHVFRPSRLQIYYDERVLEGTEHYDSGAQIRDGAKVLAKIGTCPEYMWPYDESKALVKPDARCYVEARKHQALTYWRVPQTEVDLEACLADGYPVIFGFTVYESFESGVVAASGMVPMPRKREPVVGGHCVVLVGYDKARRLFYVRNSWGENWGDNGYCYMPYEYITNGDLADDFWTLRNVE